MIMTKNISNILSLIFILGVLSGCSGSSIFVSYPSQMDDTKQAIASGDFLSVKTKMEKKFDSNDKLLHLMEAGRISQLANDIDGSTDSFSSALEIIQEKESEAVITASGAVDQAGAIMLNDNAIPYEAELYERVFIHNYQALNYVFKNDLEAAGVEVRRANMEQSAALKEFADEIEDAEESSTAQSILDSNKDYIEKFDQLSALSGQVKNSFQNAYTFYVSGVIYEARGESDHAYIDYKKAAEIFPNNQYLIGDLVRLAKKLGMHEDYQRFKKRLKGDLDKTPDSNQGKIVVLYEEGYVLQKEQVKVPIVILDKLHTLAFPTYVGTPQPPQPLTVEFDSNTLSSQKIVDVSALAAKALQEKLPSILTRQALKVITREQTSSGDAASALIGLAQLMINNADRRSWLTLPSNAQILHSVYTKGEHQLILKNSKASHTLSVNVVPGKTTLLHVVNVNGQFLVNSTNI